MKARASYALGSTSTVRISPQISVKSHPLCTGDFGVFATDLEQRSEMECFLRTVTPGVQLLDIGTHWGVFTLVALRAGGPASRAVCIEASDGAAQVLRENLRLNGFSESVELVNAACGEQVGQLRMLTTGAGSSDYFVVSTEDRADAVAVNQVSADSVCERSKFRPTLVKIDVEGFEEEVLRGASGILKTCRPHLFLELHGDYIRGRGKSPETVLDLLANYGYTKWRSVDGPELLSRKDLADKRYNARLSIEP